MQSKQISLIAFDLFGVLISEGHMVSATLMPLLPQDADKAQVKNFYNPYTVGQISEDEFWQGIGQANNTKLRSRFLNSFDLDLDYQTVINALAPHYQLGILSNLAADWANVLETRFAFVDQFEPIVTSGRVACGKPDRCIYDELIRQSGVGVEEILFVDDRLDNLLMAHQLGMITVHYQREIDNHPYLADYTITNLLQLIHVCGLSSY